jgi:hypothetical protein
MEKSKARANRVLTEERISYLTDRERKDKRESSDYDPRFVAYPSTALRAGPDEARKLLAHAERFVARMEAFLQNRAVRPCCPPQCGGDVRKAIG